MTSIISKQYWFLCFSPPSWLTPWACPTPPSHSRPCLSFIEPHQVHLVWLAGVALQTQHRGLLVNPDRIPPLAGGWVVIVAIVLVAGNRSCFLVLVDVMMTLLPPPPAPPRRPLHCQKQTDGRQLHPLFPGIGWHVQHLRHACSLCPLVPSNHHQPLLHVGKAVVGAGYQHEVLAQDQVWYNHRGCHTKSYVLAPTNTADVFSPGTLMRVGPGQGCKWCCVW